MEKHQCRDPEIQCQEKGELPPAPAPFSELPMPRLTQRAFCSFAGCRGALPAAARPPAQRSRCRPPPPFPACRLGGLTLAAWHSPRLQPSVAILARRSPPPRAAPRPAAAPPRPRLSKGAGDTSRPGDGAAVPAPCDTDRGASPRPGLDQPGPPVTGQEGNV